MATATETQQPKPVARDAKAEAEFLKKISNHVPTKLETLTPEEHRMYVILRREGKIARWTSNGRTQIQEADTARKNPPQLG